MEKSTVVEKTVRTCLQSVHSIGEVPRFRDSDIVVRLPGITPEIEAAWAMKVHSDALLYMDILRSCDPKDLHLCPNDDLIYEDFRSSFKDLNVEVIDEDDLKSDTEKEKWRHFAMRYKGVVEDYNFGSLLRANCHGDYSSENSFLVYRIQFLAIETARNREGLNSRLRHLKND